MTADPWKTDPISFTSSIDLPDGRKVYVSIELPQAVAAEQLDAEIVEHAEVAQMAAGTVLRNLLRADEARRERNEVPF